MLVVYFTWQFWFICLQVESEGHVVNGLCACSVSVHGWCITFMTAPPQVHAIRGHFLLLYSALHSRV